MIPLYRTDPYLFAHETTLDSVIAEGDTQLIICHELIFAEGGGQPPDHGIIRWKDQTREVKELVKHKGDVRLRIQTIEGLQKGEKVRCEIDPARRSSIMRLHSAQHGFAGALRRVLPGYHTGGMSISDDATTCAMRFAATQSPDDRVMKNALEIVGEAIALKRAVSTEIFESAEIAAKSLGDLFRPSDPRVQLKGRARVVIIEGLDANACGGTHVRDFSEVKGVTLEKLEGGDVFVATFSVVS